MILSHVFSQPSSRDPEKVRHACAYRPRGGKKAVKPKWVSCNSQKYYPSYNVSPQSNTYAPKKSIVGESKSMYTLGESPVVSQILLTPTPTLPPMFHTILSLHLTCPCPLESVSYCTHTHSLSLSLQACYYFKPAKTRSKGHLRVRQHQWVTIIRQIPRLH